MQTKKILGIALAAALVGSMATVAVSAREAMDDSEVATYFDNHTIGIVGSMTGWGSEPDIPMYRAAEDSAIYVGVVQDLDAGSYDFKVRADSAWDDSWGVYEADYDRTFNSQTNCHVDITEDGTDLFVILDALGEDGNVWPVSFGTTTTDTATEYGIVGSMTGWGEQPDVVMYKTDGGVVGKIKVSAGDYEFKVRKDSAWTDSWGAYEADYDRTYNSQTNCKLSVTEDTTIIVLLNTLGEDEELWPVSYMYYGADGKVTIVNTGKVEEQEPVGEPSPYGIVGSMTGWGEQPDIQMYYNDDNTAVIGKVTFEPGSYEFKVRKDSAWTDSWGAYEADYERTYNSQTNLSFTCENTTTVTVLLDMSGDDEELWPISYTYRAGGDDSELADMVYVYTGKEEEQESSVPSDVSEVSDTSEVSEVSDTSEVSDAEPEYYESQKTDYVYFDNSQTKWDKVYAYWWNSDFTKVIDKLTGKDYPEFYTEDGAGQAFDKWYPGQEMTQIEGTDIWQARVPYGATKFIFNSGVKDEDVRNGVEAFQTVDLDFSDETNAGQIYVIDVNGELKPGRGIEKTKFRYQAGEWKDYEGVYMVETFGEKPVDPSEIIEEPSKTESEDEGSKLDPTPGASTPSTPSTPGTSTPATGDSTMPIAIAAVAVAAMGIVLVGSKKKAKN